MGLVGDLEAPIEVVGTCKYKVIYDDLSSDEQDALSDALGKVIRDERSSRAKQYSCEWLSQVLTRNGYPISRSTISRHINEDCNCAKGRYESV